jgi:hypothetical protein
MIIGMLAFLLFLVLVMLINRSLKCNSKECDFEISFNLKGFKLVFKTTKEGAPSSNKRLP